MKERTDYQKEQIANRVSEDMIQIAKDLIPRCRKVGAINEDSLRHFPELADEAADCIEDLLETISRLQTYQLKPGMFDGTWKTPIVRLPNGQEIFALMETNKSITIYRASQDPAWDDESIVFAEYDSIDGESDPTLIAGAYCSCDCDTRYYAPYDQENGSEAF